MAGRTLPALGPKAAPAAPVLKEMVARSFAVKGQRVAPETRERSILALRCMYDMAEHTGDPRPLTRRFIRELHVMGEAGDWYFIWMLPKCGKLGAKALLEIVAARASPDAIRALMRSEVDRITLGFELERLRKSGNRAVADAADAALDEIAGRKGKKPSLKGPSSEIDDDLGLE
jgi:hypothetical protein